MSRTDLDALARNASPAVRDALRAHALRSCPPSERPALAAQLQARDAHAAQGKAAQASGGSTEDAVERVLRELMPGVVADYSRHDATVKASGGTVLYRVAAGCDFTGILSTREGFAIEAKQGARLWRTEEERDAARKTRDPHLTPKQTTQLDRHHRAGCLALVAMVAREQVRVVSWALLSTLWDDRGAVEAGAWAMGFTLRETIQQRVTRGR